MPLFASRAGDWVCRVTAGVTVSEGLLSMSVTLGCNGLDVASDLPGAGFT